MSEQTPDFEAILALLNNRGVEFVVIGGLAAIYHGHSRVTFDVDICYSRTPDNLERLAQVLRELNAQLRGAPSGMKFKLDSRTLKSGMNFTFSTIHGDLDTLGEVSGVGEYDACLDGAGCGTVSGIDVPILSLDKLISAKKAAGRKKDLEVVPDLIALKEIIDRAKNDPK